MGLILEYGGCCGVVEVSRNVRSVFKLGGMLQASCSFATVDFIWCRLDASTNSQVKMLLPQVNVHHITIQQPQPPFSFLPPCSGSFSGISGTLVICIGSGDSARCGCCGLDSGLAGGLSWILGMVE